MVTTDGNGVARSVVAGILATASNAVLASSALAFTMLVGGPTVMDGVLGAAYTIKGVTKPKHPHFLFSHASPSTDTTAALPNILATAATTTTSHQPPRITNTTTS